MGSSAKSNRGRIDAGEVQSSGDIFTVELIVECTTTLVEIACCRTENKAKIGKSATKYESSYHRIKNMKAFQLGKVY